MSDTAKILNLKHGSPDWHKYRQRAEEDLYWFNAIVLGFADKFPMERKTHAIPHLVMQRTTGIPEIDEAPIQLLMWPRECAPAEQQVLIADGTYKRHDQLKVGDFVLSKDVHNEFGWFPISAISVEHQPCKRIKLRTGRSITVSNEHPLFQIDGWQAAEELQIGDRVALTRHTPEPALVQELPEAAFLGYMIGDGCMPGMTFVNADPAILEDFHAAVARCGGSTATRQTHGRVTTIGVRGLRQLIRDHQLADTTSHTKTIPQAVFQSTNTSVAAFLRAYYSCDGDVSRSCVNLSSVNRTLLEDVQHLLLRFGIVSRLQRKNGQYNGAPHKSWRLVFSDGPSKAAFLTHIGFVGDRQARLIAAVKRSTPRSASRDTIPHEWKHRLPDWCRDKQRGTGSLRHQLGIRIDNTYATTAEKVLQVAEIIDDPLLTNLTTQCYWDEIVTIEDLPSQEVYAVEVPATGSYCINDVVTHNTGKSTCGTVGFSIWEACKNPDIAILIANETEPVAQGFLESIKWHFMNNMLLRVLFPEVLPPDFNKTTWSSTRATLRRSTGRPEATFEISGTAGTKTGRHYDIILGDDVISKNAMEAARAGNWDLIERANRWINQSKPLLSNAAKERLGKGYPFRRFIGTSWWKGDTYEWLEENYGTNMGPTKRWNLRVKLPDGSHVEHEIYRTGMLAVLKMAAIERGQLTFPRIWDQASIDELRSVDPELFACNLMNDPSDAAITTFKPEWLHYWRYLDDHTVTYKLEDGTNRFVRIEDLLKRAVTDPAFTANNKSASRAGIIVVGTDMETGKHLILDSSAKRQDPESNLVDFLTTLERWHCRLAYVELAGQQLAYLQWLEAEARRRNIPVVFDKVTPGGRSKDLRIEGLIVPFKQHDIYVGPGQNALLDEYRHWRPGSQESDTLDALAYAMETVPKPAPGIATDARTRNRLQLESYRRRRGLTGVA